MSDSSQVGLFYVKETVIGTTPASALKQLRFTGESLKDDYASTQSDEIRPDRNLADVIRTLITPAGSFNFELSYGTYDDFFALALYSGWEGIGTGTTETLTSDLTASNLDMTVDKDAGTITLGSALVFDTDWTAVAGQFVKLVTSDTDTDIDGIHEITDVAGNVLTIPSLTGTGSKVYDETPTLTIKGSFLSNGVTEQSMTIEKKYADKTKFHSFTGVHVGGFSLDVAAEQKITGNFDLSGMGSATAGATVGTGAAEAATSTDVMSAGFNVSTVRENGAAVSAVRQITMNVTNNLRSQSVVGSTSLFGIGAGTFDAQFELTQYFSDYTLYDKLAAGTATSLDFRLSDNAGNVLIPSFPQVKYTAGEILAGGPNQDVVAKLNAQALLDPAYGFTMGLSRIPA
jgi:hypothetical protein